MEAGKVGPDNLVSAVLLAMTRRVQLWGLPTETWSRRAGHATVIVVAGMVALLAAYGTRFADFDYGSLSEAALHPSAFSQRPSAAGDDVLIKPLSVVTHLVNRPRQGLVTHIVQQGETISSIAEAYNVSINTVIWANGLREDETIQPGTKLIVLPVSGVLHEVKPGESVEDIARAYQSDAEAIIDFNQMTDPAHPVAGDKLVVPGGRLEPPPRAEASARSGERPRVEDGAVEDKKAKPMEVSVYRVEPGDTLAGIAERYGVSVDTICQANNINDPELISEGQELTILPVDGILYEVKSGDSLNGVAERFQADAAEIIRANALADPGNLQIDQKLIIPGGKLPPPPAIVAEAPAPAPAAPAPNPQPQPQAKAVPAPAAAPAPPTSDKGSAIVGVASKYLGRPYVWGGHSPAGFDCSGFTWYVYREVGLYLPGHDLWGQLQSGPRIKQANLAPGDLVFFENTYTWGLSHVGIYIGGGRFIHAASEWQGVRVSSLSESYWAGRYFGACRPW